MRCYINSLDRIVGISHDGSEVQFNDPEYGKYVRVSGQILYEPDGMGGRRAVSWYSNDAHHAAELLENFSSRITMHTSKSAAMAAWEADKRGREELEAQLAAARADERRFDDFRED